MIYQLVSVLFDGFVVISATLFKISKVVYSFKDYGNFEEIRVWSVFQWSIAIWMNVANKALFG